MLDVTHLLFALALAYILEVPVVYAMIAAVFPSIDILFAAPEPFVPNGIIHTPIFAAFAMAILYLATNRSIVAFATGIGLLSHLYLDTLDHGIMWLYPLTDSVIAFQVLSETSITANLAVMTLSVLTMVSWRYKEVIAWRNL